MEKRVHETDSVSLPSHTNSVENAIDPEAQRRLVHKLDLILLPLFTVVYATNFIDRTAIGNAKIAGIEHDLGMVGFDYNIALTIFYIFYISAEIPSNLALKHFGSMWLALMVTGFGIVSIGTAFVKNYAGLIITRVFLGLAEGGTLSGLTYIMSRYYRRTELVLRVGIFFGLAPPLAGAFGGLLASGLLSINDIGMVKSWRKIFLIEGIITSGFGLLCFLIIPTDPQRSRMLSESERELALARIAADQAVSTHGKKERTTLRLVGRAFNINTCVLAFCYVLVNISFQGLSLFMPTVVATLGHFTTVKSQLRTVPPYVAGAVWALIGAYHGFRIKQRATPIIISVLLMVIGYAIFVGTENSHARYAACFLAVAGGSPSGPMILSWGTDNAAPDTVRAVTTAIIPGVGALGSVIAVWTYLPSDAPNYHHGNSLNLSTSSLCVVLVALLAMYIRFENAKRARGERDYRLEGKSTEEIEQLGYLHPRFRYQM
ncbi:MFS general substrate transporter [Fomitiporia mediterranea MF3/22]|uniref:MFS general substrate transporter n=1 Tax=Fomitiporia mediterranea (strain MF3/22) TaxID=694068 RepID=UPI00044076FB|nr:MFS general substrate transporter [Fomitiporia mediterranea MF3/22]EJD00698.1 MFS general substrate transporter [Fomitiporia mediterranea MF3/22]